MNKNQSIALTPEWSLISVVVVTYNSERTIRRLVDSLVQHIGSVIGEIVIVDNNSDDKTLEILTDLKSEYKLVRVLPQEINLGYRRGANLGAHECSYEIILFINPDSWLANDSLLSSYQWMLRSPTIACCYPSIESPSYHQSVHATSVVVPFILPYIECNDSEKSGARVTDLPAGPCLFLKKSIFLRIGGFDEEVFMYGEEEELFLKLSRIGCVSIYTPDAVVIHVGAGSTLGLSLRESLWLKRILPSAAYLYFKYYDDSNLTKRLWWLFFFGLSLGWSLIARSWSPLLQAIETFRIRDRLPKKGIYKSRWRLELLPQALAAYIGRYGYLKSMKRMALAHYPN